ncbi:MAG: DegV family protein [Clostridia bacterium]
MNKEKIAILVDSCTDVPKDVVKKYGIYVVPLKIIYKDKVYTDGVDISSKEIYKNLHKETPSTSLPSGEEIMVMLQKIKDDGYEKVLAITISSGLSGTHNFIKLLGEEFEGLEFCTIDTKSIGIGAGMTAILAATNLASGMKWDELCKATLDSVKKTQVFFCVSTLEYLRKGGRIGLVASSIGTLLTLKPIISCNEDGIYYNVAKTIGRKKSLQKVVEIAEEYASRGIEYNVAIANGNASEEAKEIKKILKKSLTGCKGIYEGQISPALVVHTGPGLVGVGIQLLK